VGRIRSELGQTAGRHRLFGIAIDPETVDIWFGNLPVCTRGARAPEFDESTAYSYLQQREIVVRINLGLERVPPASDHRSDAEYVRINADYST